MKSFITYLLGICQVTIIHSSQDDRSFTGYAHQLANGKWGFINSVYPIEEDGTLQVQQTDGHVIRVKIKN